MALGLRGVPVGGVAMLMYCASDRMSNLNSVIPGNWYRLICAGTLGAVQYCTVAILLDLKAISNAVLRE